MSSSSTPKENLTRDGIEVKPGQIWRDLDRRQDGRTVTVVSVTDGKARVTDGVTATTLSIRRMHQHSTGFQLVRDVSAS